MGGLTATQILNRAATMNASIKVLSVCLGLGCTVVAVGGQTLWDDLTIEQQLSGPIHVRIKALNKVVASKEPLAKPEVRRVVIKDLNQSNHDPDWEQLNEKLEYEEYYSDLLSTTEKIATLYHDPAAWQTLVSSIYNDDSPFALWLAAQPEALPTLLDFAHQSKDVDTEGRALYVLAEALERCTSGLSDKTCAPVNQRRGEILELLRQGLQNPHVSIPSVRGLGICGEKQDLALLDQAQPAPSGQDSPEVGRHFFEKIVRKAQQQIESRLEQK